MKLLGRKPTHANTADLNPLNLKGLRASSIRGQPTPLPLLLPRQKKTTREPSAHSKPLRTDSSIPFACHAKENIVFIRAVARLCQIPGLAFLQCIYFVVQDAGCKVKSANVSQVNSTEELLAIPHLFQALKRRFSRSHVRLLVLVDHQDSPLRKATCD